ncbi:hypothetical protein ACFYT4_10230 [Streptomyces sp. NPDC004609]|uniref:hypothetical protein n=1 Tax=Streptomyces sp. NPDC004609 TaxID=3364704 RepID=UPI0036AEBFC5
MAQHRARWNAETQSWDRGGEPAAYAPPPPPPPGHAPGTGAPAGARAGSPLVRTPVVVAAAAAVLAAAGTAVWLTTAAGDDKNTATPGPAASAAPSGTDSVPSEPDVSAGTAGDTYASEEPPGGEDTATPSASSPPPAFRITEDEEGFTIAVPEGWERTSGRNGVFYTAGDRRSLLQVFVISETFMTPLGAVRAASEGLAARTEEYRELSRGPVGGGPENPEGDAAELHYAYRSEEAGGVRECVERAFTATNGTKYAVLACAPAEQPGERHSVLTTALEHFAPAAG